MEVIFLVSIFISLSIIIESLGVWLRFVGSLNKEAALGYSSHVRVATLGRFFILISAPILGFLTDNGATREYIANIGVFSFSIVFFSFLVSYYFEPNVFFLNIYKILNRNSVISSLDIKQMNYTKRINYKLTLFSLLSFLLTSSGILIVNYFATIFTENRGMIVQMAAFVTMAGTLMHAFLVDPVLARLCDLDSEKAYNSVRSFILGRLISSFILICFFTLIGFL